MKQVILKYGLLAGALLAALMFLTMPFLEKIGDMGMVLGYASIFVGLTTIFFGVRAYRNGAGSGKLTFGRAFLIGLAITAIASICYAAAWEVLSRTYMPDFVEKYSARVMDKARAEGMPEADLAKQQQELDQFATMYENPLFRIPMVLLEPLPVGLILSLVAAAVFRRAAL